MKEPKTYKLYFRWRNVINDLQDGVEEVAARSKAEALRIGKDLAADRAPSYAGKYWFMGLF